MDLYTFLILLAIVVTAIILVGRDGCGSKRRDERYAPQVMHGVVGGIAGPMLPDSMFVPPVPKNIPMLMKIPRDEPA
jgi:hypothetical protein